MACICLPGFVRGNSATSCNVDASSVVASTVSVAVATPTAGHTSSNGGGSNGVVTAVVVVCVVLVLGVAAGLYVKKHLAQYKPIQGMAYGEEPMLGTAYSDAPASRGPKRAFVANPVMKSPASAYDTDEMQFFQHIDDDHTSINENIYEDPTLYATAGSGYSSGKGKGIVVNNASVSSHDYIRPRGMMSAHESNDVRYGAVHLPHVVPADDGDHTESSA